MAITVTKQEEKGSFTLVDEIVENDAEMSEATRTGDEHVKEVKTMQIEKEIEEYGGDIEIKGMITNNEIKMEEIQAQVVDPSTKVNGKVKLTVSGLRADIEAGYTRPQLANKYGIVIGQMTKAIAQAGLKGVKAKHITFELSQE